MLLRTLFRWVALGARSVPAVIESFKAPVTLPFVASLVSTLLAAYRGTAGRPRASAMRTHFGRVTTMAALEAQPPAREVIG